MIVSTQTQYDTSSEIEIFLTCGNYSHHEKFLNQPATHKYSLNFNAFDEISSVRNDTLHVNYPQPDYCSSYTATLPHQDLSAIMTKVFHD